MHSAFVWCEELCKSWGILSTEAEGRALRDSDRAAAKETIASFASLWIGHFRVPKTLTFKMRPSAQPFLWMSYICMRMKKHFHIKGWALNLVLIQSPGEGGGGNSEMAYLFYRKIYYADHVITLTLHNAKLVPIVGTSFSENSTREDSLASHEGGNVLYAIQF